MSDGAGPGGNAGSRPAQDGSRDPSSPFSGGLPITVSMPATAEIRFVQEGLLKDYEIWIWVASALGIALSGLLGALISGPPDPKFEVAVIVLGVFTAIFYAIAFLRRRDLGRKTIEYPMKAFDTGSETNPRLEGPISKR